jgi:ADP-L-glycero-D-manno-heptose 6-epimerase
MIVVTGGAGFIGSNLVRGLNARGERDVLVADDLTDGHKFANLSDCEIADYVDHEDFLARAERDGLPPGVTAVFHQGACSTTTEWDGRYMMRTNHDYSKRLLALCEGRGLPFIYASSASVYGVGREFREEPACEAPVNVYGWSKRVFDDYVRRRLPAARSPIVGLRYFNVYGPRESHKGSMASVAFHFNGQMLRDGRVRLFQGTDGYADGEQLRDFIHVDDVVAVNLWFLDRAPSGIYNVGTGQARSFNDVARAVLRHHGRGEIEYVPFPDSLRGSYQSYTQADLTRLRAAGYDAPFLSIEEGVSRYLAGLGA